MDGFQALEMYTEDPKTDKKINNTAGTQPTDGRTDVPHAHGVLARITTTPTTDDRKPNEDGRTHLTHGDAIDDFTLIEKYTSIYTV